MNSTHGKIMNREVISRGFTVDHNTLSWLKATVLIALLCQLKVYCTLDYPGCNGVGGGLHG